MILTQPVPNSFSTNLSAIIGISLFIIGNIHFLPTRSLYLSSSGCTAIAVSPSIVSGLVVATVKYLSSPTTLYLICHKCVGSSSYIASASDMEVWQEGHQFIILLPL